MAKALVKSETELRNITAATNTYETIKMPLGKAPLPPVPESQVQAQVHQALPALAEPAYISHVKAMQAIRALQGPAGSGSVTRSMVALNVLPPPEKFEDPNGIENENYMVPVGAKVTPEKSKSPDAIEKAPIQKGEN